MKETPEYKKVRELVESRYKTYPFEPNPFARAALVDGLYEQACKEVGVKPIKK